MDIDVSKLPSHPETKVDRLYVTVYLTNSLEKPGFKGFVKSLSSFDTKGPFDVLPMHENFVTEFSKKLEVIPEEGEKVVYDKVNGVIEVTNNVARIFVDQTKGDLNETK